MVLRDRLRMESTGREFMRGIIRLGMQWNMQIRGQDERRAQVMRRRRWSYLER
jgi:hypothetical protein